ncbi:MAG: hypothetical protein ACOX2K_09060 [Bacillota bacterium]|jgi:hypothetical protein
MTGHKKAMAELETALDFSLQDLGATPDAAEMDSLLETLKVLSQYTAPEPDRGSTARLISSLRGQLPAMPATEPRFRQQMEQGHPAWHLRLLQLLRPQVSVLGKPFWLASLLICGLGLLLINSISAQGMIPLLMAAPLLAAGSIAFAFRHQDQRVLELETSAALPMQQLVLARLAIVLFVNCLSLSVLSLVAARLLPSLSLGSLLLCWLAPLLLWSGITLDVCLRYGQLAGLAAGCGSWALQLFLRYLHPELDLLKLAQEPGEVMLRLGVLLAAAVLLALTVRRAGKGDAWVAARLPR